MTDVNEPVRYDGRDLAMLLGDLRFEREMWEHGRYPDVVVAIDNGWVEIESYEYDSTQNVIVLNTVPHV